MSWKLFHTFLGEPLFFCITKPLSKNYNDRSKNTLNIEFESSCVDLHLVREMLLKCKWKSLFCFFVSLFGDFLYLIIIMLDILILIFWSSYTSTVVFIRRLCDIKNPNSKFFLTKIYTLHNILNTFHIKFFPFVRYFRISLFFIRAIMF